MEHQPPLPPPNAPAGDANSESDPDHRQQHQQGQAETDGQFEARRGEVEGGTEVSCLPMATSNDNRALTLATPTVTVGLDGGEGDEGDTRDKTPTALLATTAGALADLALHVPSDGSPVSGGYTPLVRAVSSGGAPGYRVCPICRFELSPEDSLRLGCSCGVHHECLTGYIINSLGDRSVSAIITRPCLCLIFTIKILHLFFFYMRSTHDILPAQTHTDICTYTHA
jgi:hypothetical protein